MRQYSLQNKNHFQNCFKSNRIKQFTNKMPYYPSQIRYSDRFKSTDGYEYTSVLLPKEIVRKVEGKGLLTNKELNELGCELSKDWENYMKHDPEPHVVLLRRKIKS